MRRRLKFDFIFGDFASIFGKYGAGKKSLQLCNSKSTATDPGVKYLFRVTAYPSVFS